MEIQLRETPFDPYALLRDFEREPDHLRAHFGAASLFIGTMRDFNEGEAVESLWFEHYPRMTEQELQRIAQEVQQSAPFKRGLIVHRVGHIVPGETIVLIGTWSCHRAEAITATSRMIEALKHRAPFWKKEQRGTKSHWVESNTPGSGVSTWPQNP